jgi:hypothetical protein
VYVCIYCRLNAEEVQRRNFQNFLNLQGDKGRDDILQGLGICSSAYEPEHDFQVSLNEHMYAHVHTVSLCA